jgi:hypothetical protein
MADNNPTERRERLNEQNQIKPTRPDETRQNHIKPNRPVQAPPQTPSTKKD